MTDIIERAEAALELYASGRGDDFHYKSALIRDLLAELKAARAENERLRPRWIETVEELRELQPTPELLGGVLIKALGAPAIGAVFELNDDGSWNDFDSAADRTAAEDVPLPAVVLWKPEKVGGS